MMSKEYEIKKSRLVRYLQDSVNSSEPVAISKSTSNLFRDRENKPGKINVKHFNNVISVDRKNLTCEVEGMTTYEKLVAETLKYGLIPAVVPELKTITIGGAATGIGIESSSFRYGFVHEPVLEMED